MVLFNLKRYDVQAKASLVLAIVSALPIVAAAYAAYRRFDPEMRAITYGSQSLLKPALLGCVVVGVLMSGLAVVLGANSAGQRRNARQAQSWLGFFLGAFMLACGLIVGAGFWMLQVAVR